jgi:hypothetical protein
MKLDSDVLDVPRKCLTASIPMLVVFQIASMSEMYQTQIQVIAMPIVVMPKKDAMR